VQVVIIGVSNKNYSFVRNINNEVIQLKDLFDQNKILYKKNLQNAKLEEDTLIVRKLTRIFWISSAGVYKTGEHTIILMVKIY